MRPRTWLICIYLTRYAAVLTCGCFVVAIVRYLLGNAGPHPALACLLALGAITCWAVTHALASANIALREYRRAAINSRIKWQLYTAPQPNIVVDVPERRL